MDGRVRVERVAGVMQSLAADAIAAQEILLPQAEEIAELLSEYEMNFGENRRIGGVPYGNATFSRLRVRHTINYDVTHARREPRGVLRNDVESRGSVVHLFNCHLGTSYSERRAQAAKLLSEELLQEAKLGEALVICGDLNEWLPARWPGELARVLHAVRSRRSYPGLLPVLRLDRMYHGPGLRLERVVVCRSRQALVASDHLPLVADFTVL